MHQRQKNGRCRQLQKTRLNHAVAGLGIVLAGLLIAFSSTQQMIKVSLLPGAGIDLKGLHIGLDPSTSTGVEDGIRTALVVIAIILGVCGLLLLMTKIRFLGLLWRLLAYCALAVAGFLAYVLWDFIRDPVKALTSQNPSLLDQIGSTLGQVSLGLGITKVEAGPGLYFLSLGTALGAILLLVPAIRNQTPLEAHPVGASSPPAGWYLDTESGRTENYWDGSKWTGHRRLT